MYFLSAKSKFTGLFGIVIFTTPLLSLAVMFTLVPSSNDTSLVVTFESFSKDTFDTTYLLSFELLLYKL